MKLTPCRRCGEEIKVRRRRRQWRKMKQIKYVAKCHSLICKNEPTPYTIQSTRVKAIRSWNKINVAMSSKPITECCGRGCDDCDVI